VGEIAAKAVVQLFPMRKASTWSTQVREAETHSSIMSNPYAVVRALQTTVKEGTGERHGRGFALDGPPRPPKKGNDMPERNVSPSWPPLKQVARSLDHAAEMFIRQVQCF
jgi:hypothetical protein